MDSTQLGAVQAAVETAVQGTGGKWAGWIGVVANGDVWEWETHPGNPDIWDADATTNEGIGTIGFCTSDDGVIVGTTPTIPENSSWRHAPAPARLALVLSGGKWCLGSPTFIGGEAQLRAHYVCERPVPEKTVYDIYATSGDTDQ
jgi:hypothetical protein